MVEAVTLIAKAVRSASVPTERSWIGDWADDSTPDTNFTNPKKSLLSSS